MKIHFKSLLLIVSILTVLAGCSSNNGNSPAEGSNTNTSPAANEELASNNTQPDAEPGGPRELTDPLGHTVTIPANPERILASYLEDYLAALDITPVAQWSVGDSPMDYLESYFKDVPVIAHDLPFESVTSFSPDLIIIGDESLIADNKYDSYNKIAPTYALGSEINADWRKAFAEIGKIVGKEAEVQASLEAYDAKAAEAKAKIEAAGSPSAAAIWLVGGTFWIVVDDQSSGAVMYQDLGLKVPSIVTEISEGEGNIWRSLSLEAMAELDTDHIFLINSDAATGSEALKDPIWTSLPAVVNGNVHEFDADLSSWLYTGPIANDMIVDAVVDSILK